MANIKISEMTEASTFEDGDYTMIVQSNQNKKINKENMFSDIEYSITQLDNKIDNISYCRMNTSGSPTITTLEKLTGWENPQSFGDYTADTANNRLIITNTTILQLNGATGGYGRANFEIIVLDSNNNPPSNFSAKNLFQYGDVYWADNLNSITVVLDPTKTYYVTLNVETYSPSTQFQLNNGFGKYQTWISALKIK